MSHYSEDELKNKRIRLIEMFDDPFPIEPGSEGVVMGFGLDVIHIKWDNGRSLGLIDGIDKFEIID